MTKANAVSVERGDLLAAWAVLENLAVSLDQIGGSFAVDPRDRNGKANDRALQQALNGYLKPQLVREIRDARTRLGQYVSDAEAERTARQIAYWDYRKPRSRVRRKMQR